MADPNPPNDPIPFTTPQTRTLPSLWNTVRDVFWAVNQPPPPPPVPIPKHDDSPFLKAEEDPVAFGYSEERTSEDDQVVVDASRWTTGHAPGITQSEYDMVQADWAKLAPPGSRRLSYEAASREVMIRKLAGEPRYSAPPTWVDAAWEVAYRAVVPASYRRDPYDDLSKALWITWAFDNPGKVLRKREADAMADEARAAVGYKPAIDGVKSLYARPVSDEEAAYILESTFAEDFFNKTRSGLNARGAYRALKGIHRWKDWTPELAVLAAVNQSDARVKHPAIPELTPAQQRLVDGAEGMQAFGEAIGKRPGGIYERRNGAWELIGTAPFARTTGEFLDADAGSALGVTGRVGTRAGGELLGQKGGVYEMQSNGRWMRVE